MAESSSPSANWRSTSIQKDRDRGTALRNDLGKDNGNIQVTSLGHVFEDENGPFRKATVRGGQSVAGVFREYTVLMNKHGIVCDCPHHRTCKHCINVLHDLVGVPFDDLLSTPRIKLVLRQYFDHTFVVLD